MGCENACLGRCQSPGRNALIRHNFGLIDELRLHHSSVTPIDTLSGDSEHAGDVGGRATMVELQDGEGPPEEAGIPGLSELTPEAPPLPGSQVESAHGLLPDR